MNIAASIPVQPVIMAGGSGTRLWPLSRALYPKQFLVLSGNRSLFQQAAQRLNQLGGDGLALQAPCIVGNEEHRFLVLDQLREGGRVVIPVGDRYLQELVRVTRRGGSNVHERLMGVMFVPMTGKAQER